MNFKLIKFLSLILISSSLQAYTYRADVFENQGKKIYLLSDFHEHTKNTKKQVIDSINAAKSLDASIVVENYDHDFIKSNNIDENDIKSCYLGLLSYECKSANIQSFNVDFRGNLGLFLSENEVKLETLLNDYKQALEKTSSYNDGPVLNKFYKETYQSVTNNINNLGQHKKCNYKDCCKDKLFLKKAKKYSESIKADSKQLAFDCILYMAWGLLEARILHEIYTSEKQNIFVCVGGYHNATLEPILTKQLGYKKIYSYGDSHESENPKNINIENTFKKIQMNQIYNKLPEELNSRSLSLIMLFIYLMAIISKLNLACRYRKRA